VNHEEQIVAAYAAGETVAHIGKRMGASTDDVLRVVAQETAPGAAPPPELHESGRRTPWITTVGISLLVLGAIGPCAGGALWLAVYYASVQVYPIGSWGYGNLAVGFIGIVSGLVMILTGATLLLANRRRRQAGSQQYS
jgi:hypothetical protein